MTTKVGKRLYNKAHKLFTEKLVTPHENRVKEVLGELYSTKDIGIVIIDRSTATGLYKELYDEGAVLVIKSELYDSMHVWNEMYYPIQDEFKGLNLECYNPGILTVWED